MKIAPRSRMFQGQSFGAVPQAIKQGVHMGDFLRIVIAILIPPLGVFLAVGLTGAFFLNILLTILGYIPGIVHAVWVISKN